MLFFIDVCNFFFRFKDKRFCTKICEIDIYKIKVYLIIMLNEIMHRIFYISSLCIIVVM